jgi:hypothetical protein
MTTHREAQKLQATKARRASTALRVLNNAFRRNKPMKTDRFHTTRHAIRAVLKSTPHFVFFFDAGKRGGWLAGYAVEATRYCGVDVAVMLPVDLDSGDMYPADVVAVPCSAVSLD